MTREQAINYLISSGFTHEQVGEVVRALTYEPTTKNDSSELEKNSKKLEKDFGELDCISRADAIQAMQDKAKKLTNEDTINGLCGAVAILYEMPSVTSQLSVPEVTALAEWTEKLTKASEDAYNKGYVDGMKAQAEHESLCKEEREISKEKAIEILKADSIASYSVEDILSARDMAIKTLEQEPISDILEDIYFDIEKEYEDCVIGKLDDDDNIMNPCFRQITDIYGVLDIIGKYIDKYKPGSEEEDGNDD